MEKKYLKSLLTFKKAASYGISVGFILLLFGFIENDFSRFFAAFGAGTIVASMVIFGFGMSLSLLEEFVVNSKGNPRLKKEFAVYSKKFYN